MKYDRGKVVAGGEFKHAGLLNMPPSILTNAVAKLRAIHEKKRNAITRNITLMINKTQESEDANPDFADQYQCPGLEYDQSFDANYDHNDSVEPAPGSKQDEKSSDEDEDKIPLPCPNCDKTRLVRRKPRKTTDPVIHYGTIASADQVMRHGATRERIRKQYSVLCFEMEAAGLMNDFPCLVIRGICDYSGMLLFFPHLSNISCYSTITLKLFIEMHSYLLTIQIHTSTKYGNGMQLQPLQHTPRSS